MAKVLDYDGLDHVVDKIYDVVQGGGSADYIVEQGTSGIWTYRKWASGIAECWGTHTVNITSWDTWGNLCEGKPSFQVSYPTGLFLSAPTLTASADGTPSNVGNCGLELFRSGSATQTPIMYVLRPNSTTTGNQLVHMHARGTWKTFTPTVVPNNPLSGVGSYAWTSGQITSKSWAVPNPLVTWTAPSDGLYLISTHIVTVVDDGYTSTYKMFRWVGTATAFLEAPALYFRGTTDGAGYGINGTAWTFPVLARQGQTVSPYVYTGTANVAYNVQVFGVKVGSYVENASQ